MKLINIRNYSIKTKLVLLFSLSSVIALIISTTANMTYFYLEDKKKIINTNIHLAQVSGKNIAASLMFLDQDSTRTILEPLLSDTNVKLIKIYDTKGKLFTVLGQDISKSFFSKQHFSSAITTEVISNLESINVLTPITHANESIGFLELVLSTDELIKILLDQIKTSFLIIFLTTIVMVVLALWFEKIFTNPIFELLNAMRALKKTGRFDLQLMPSTQNEFRELFIEFNHMANEINKRDKVLKDHNLNLEKLVSTTNEQLELTKHDLEKVSVIATIDELTQLKNRRFIMEKFDDMILMSQKLRQYLGVIMLDIDYFKNVNDDLGHHAGDIILKDVAQILQQNARDIDIVGRIGGEEFLILCANSDTQTTFNVAERIREKIETHIFTYEKNKTTQVTVSLGIYSSVPTHSKESLFKTADKALYVSKENGRNQVSIGTLQ